MSMDGETLSLPMGASMLAGFGSENDARTLAGNKQSFDFLNNQLYGGQPAAPNPLAPKDGITAATIAASDATPSAGEPAMTPMPTPQQASDRAGSIQHNQTGWDDTNQSGPHPILTDPNFDVALKTDPKRAAALYAKLSGGRDMVGDYKLMAAQQQKQQENDSGHIKRMIDQGLTFDPISGEPKILRTVTDKLGGSATQELQPLGSEEGRIVARSYTKATGLSIPTGLPKVQDLTPEQNATLQNNVRANLIKQGIKDPSVASPDAIQAAFIKEGALMKKTRDQASSLAANPAIQASSGAGNVTADYLNLVGSSVNRGVNIVNAPINQTAKWLGAKDNLVGMSPVPTVRGSQIDAALHPIGSAGNTAGNFLGQIPDWLKKSIGDPADWQ